MATYFVDTGGSNTAPYDTWAKAAPALQTALTAASGGTDLVVLNSAQNQVIAADTTYTTAASVTIISATNDGGSAYTPTAMGTANWIGESGATAYAIQFDCGADDKVFMWGLTFRIAGSTTKAIRLTNAAGADTRLENCLLWLSGSGSATITLNNSGVTQLSGCTLTFAAAGQSMLSSSDGAILVDCSITGTALTSYITSSVGRLTIQGCDLSTLSGNLVANITTSTQIVFDRCKLHASATVLATQSGNPTRHSASAFLTDCSSGDTHGVFGYYDAFGSAITESTIKVTAGAAGQSWKITTTANATYTHPFVSPWIHWYNTGTSAITPKLEIISNGGTTALKDNEIWSEWLVKTEASTTWARLSNDRQALATYLAGTAGADQTTGDLGASDWEGETTPWYGKLSPGSVTPDEAGALSARVCVGKASVAGTIFVDPQIRT